MKKKEKKNMEKIKIKQKHMKKPKRNYHIKKNQKDAKTE